MSGHHREIVPLSRHRWVLRYEGDPVALSEHATQTEEWLDDLASLRGVFYERFDPALRRHLTEGEIDDVLTQLPAESRDVLDHG